MTDICQYCDGTCQKSHWPQHKIDCQSPLAKDSWKPDWVLESRRPAFISNEARRLFGGRKYYWGNMPALDILRLTRNEGASYDGDVRLLFAGEHTTLRYPAPEILINSLIYFPASGDMRNVVETVACLPSEYTKPVMLHINDKDFDIVARNLLITLLALAAPADSQTVDCMLHLWYSATITSAHLDLIQLHVRPLIRDIVSKVKDKPDDTILGKTWTFLAGSCRTELARTQWSALLCLCEVPSQLSAEQAQRMRRAITLAPQRVDHRHRHLCAQKPAHRVSLMKFREDGILLPFGSSRQAFKVANP